MGALILSYNFAFCNDNISNSIKKWEISKDDVFQTSVEILEENITKIEIFDEISKTIKEHTLFIIKSNPELNQKFDWNNLVFQLNDIEYEWITIH